MAHETSREGAATAAAPSFTHNVTTVGTVEVKAANAKRKSLLLINYSDTLIWLALGATATVGEGIPLAPRVDADHPGGTNEITAENLYTGAITAIHGGSGNKAVVGVEV